MGERRWEDKEVRGEDGTGARKISVVGVEETVEVDSTTATPNLWNKTKNCGNYFFKFAQK